MSARQPPRALPEAAAVREEGLEIRALADAAEWHAHLALAVAAFQPGVEGADVPALVRRWFSDLQAGPELPTVLGRGAFVDGRLVGGLTIRLRAMRIGAASARTACIGGVVVDPARRLRGVGRALLEDAIREARRRRCAVVLLDGIPDFYRPFGFVDVWDPARHAVARDDVERLAPARDATVRPAREADAAALARLYRQAFGDRTGAFRHDPALASHRIRTAQASGGGVHVAVDGTGRVRGYLRLPARDRHWVREAVAAEADALRALLRWHAAIVAADDVTPAELVWELPEDSLTLALLADALTIRSEVRRQEHAGWQARAGDPRALARVVGRAVAGGGLPLDLSVDGAPCGPVGGRAAASPGAPVALSGAVWLALAFGHRPVAWAAAQPGQHLPRRAWAALEASLPGRRAWIAGGDRF